MIVAVIVAVPSATPVTVPLLTVATDDFDVVQVTVEPAGTTVAVRVVVPDLALTVGQLVMDFDTRLYCQYQIKKFDR